MLSKITMAVFGIFVSLSLLIVSSALAKGPNGPAGQSNKAHLYLYEKDSSWNIVNGGAWGKMTYNQSGSTFDYVFNGHELQPNTGYSLIYYADPWPGDNPGALIVSGTSNGGGNIHLAGSVDLTIDLPSLPDQNAVDPCEGGASPCPGAKIWLVPSSDYDATTNSMTAWNPENYLFENNSILYEDTP
ncbi:MAG: hypothetical protein Q7S44_00395 [bacterium]|nr:hypothetical protein [bacterium]